MIKTVLDEVDEQCKFVKFLHMSTEVNPDILKSRLIIRYTVTDDFSKKYEQELLNGGSLTNIVQRDINAILFETSRILYKEYRQISGTMNGNLDKFRNGYKFIILQEDTHYEVNRYAVINRPALKGDYKMSVSKTVLNGLIDLLL